MIKPKYCSSSTWKKNPLPQLTSPQYSNWYCWNLVTIHCNTNLLKHYLQISHTSIRVGKKLYKVEQMGAVLGTVGTWNNYYFIKNPCTSFTTKCNYNSSKGHWNTLTTTGQLAAEAVFLHSNTVKEVLLGGDSRNEETWRNLNIYIYYVEQENYQETIHNLWIE